MVAENSKTVGPRFSRDVKRWVAIPFVLLFGIDCRFGQAQEVFTAESAVLKIMDERQIPSLSPGLIVESAIREGSQIKENQVVVKVDDQLAQMDLNRLTSELAMARQEADSRVDIDYADKTIEVARAELRRAQNSNQRLPGAVSQSEIDKLALVVEKSIAEKDKAVFQKSLREKLYDVRKIEVEIGRKKVANHTVVAPFDGIIAEVFKKPGEWVEESEVVARLIRLDRLIAEVYIPADVALADLKNRKVHFFPSLPTLTSKKFPARVAYVHAEANPVNSNVKVWVEVENLEQELVAGLTGRLEFSSADDASNDVVAEK